MPGISACEALDLVLKYIPVDTFIEFPVEFMAVAEGDDYQPDIWEDFDAILEKQAGFKPGCRYLSRSEFYQEARNSYAVICTGENRRYGNIIISKGVIES
jgi:L-fucose mutarotase